MTSGSNSVEGSSTSCCLAGISITQPCEASKMMCCGHIRYHRSWYTHTHNLLMLSQLPAPDECMEAQQSLLGWFIAQPTFSNFPVYKISW